MVYQPGNKGGPGRPPGQANKTTLIVKEAFKEAFQAIGGAQALADWAARSEKNRTEFYKLAARLIPTEITGADGKPLMPSTKDDIENLERYFLQRLKKEDSPNDDRSRTADDAD